MLRIRIAVLPLVAALTAPVFAQNISNLYLSRAYWETFDWEKAGSSVVWLDSGFRPYNAPVATTTEYFHHNQKITIDGKVFVASLAEYTRTLLNPHFTTLAPVAEQPGDCERLSARWASAFGSTPQPISNKYFAVKGYAMDEVVRQWQIGNTRISLVCGALGPNKPDFDMIAVTYEAATDENKVEPPIYLTCARTYVLSSDQDRQQRPTQPLVLAFIPAKKVVTNADLVRVGDLDHISSSEIAFRLRAELIESKYLISRIDGTFTGSAFAKDGGRTVATYTGSCEARKPDARKF